VNEVVSADYFRGHITTHDHLFWLRRAETPIYTQGRSDLSEVFDRAAMQVIERQALEKHTTASNGN